VDWRSTHLTLVLDVDSPADHAWGEELQSAGVSARMGWTPNRTFAVRYSPPLSRAAASWTPYPLGNSSRLGYTRQVYDTFWFDTWLPSHAKQSDLLGVLDVDSPLLAFVVPQALLLPDGRLHLPALTPSHYSADSELLGMPGWLDLMWTDTMPKARLVHT
jgi:hypothetical protein